MAGLSMALVSCSALSFVGCSSTDEPGASAGSTAQAGQGASAGSGGPAATAGAASSGAGAPGFAEGGASAAAGSPNEGGAFASAGAGGTLVATGGTAGAHSAAGSGGTTGAGGSASTRQQPCNFASGLNVAWVQFGGDIPNPNLAVFRTIFKNTHDAGGRVIRWWFHTNGSVTPGYGADGKALAIQPSHITDVKAILKAANDAGVGLVISLWSFDMLQENAGAAHTNNQALLEKDENRQAYIDNYLTPLVTGLKGTPGLYAYEIFNEPEGMTSTGWATYRTTEASIQKTVNWCSAAIHAADPNVLVTSSAVTFDYCSKVSGKTNYYSDEALRAVGGKQGGTLDFYEVHYYTQNGISNSAFKHPASYWGLDKKLVMGEYSPTATDGVGINDLSKYLYENGYAGGWLWSYDADWKWPAEQGPLQTLSAAHADVSECPAK